MKWVKIYEDYNEIKKICKQYNITNWTLNSDGLVDIDGNVNWWKSRRFMHPFFGYPTKLPLKFGTINGNFYCDYTQLTSLEGAPKVVRGDFGCNNNQLTSLEYSPKIITGIFNCQHNQIRSFEGAPMYVDGSFICDGNPIFPIWVLFGDWSKVEFLNDCDAIQDRNIIMDRLNYFLGEIGKAECGEWTIERLKNRGYNIIY